jgi:hypothetical protein
MILLYRSRMTIRPFAGTKTVFYLIHRAKEQERGT